MEGEWTISRESWSYDVTVSVGMTELEDMQNCQWISSGLVANNIESLYQHLTDSWRLRQEEQQRWFSPNAKNIWIFEKRRRYNAKLFQPTKECQFFLTIPAKHIFRLRPPPALIASYYEGAGTKQDLEPTSKDGGGYGGSTSIWMIVSGVLWA